MYEALSTLALATTCREVLMVAAAEIEHHAEVTDELWGDGPWYEAMCCLNQQFQRLDHELVEEHYLLTNLNGELVDDLAPFFTPF